MNLAKKLILFCLILAPTVVSAQTEFSVTELTGAGDVLTDGILVKSVNCGYAVANGDVTVNGLAFAAGGTETEGGIDDFSQVWGTGLRALGWGVGTIFTGDAGTTDAFNNLFNSIAWQTGAVGVGNTLTLHLTGLTAGEDYRLQMFFGDTRSNQNHPFNLTVEGGTSEIYTYGTASDAIASAIRVDAYFNASATDVDVTLTVPDYTPIGGGLMLSAYALHVLADIDGGQSSPSLLLLNELRQNSKDLTIQLTGSAPSEDVLVTVDPSGIAETATDIQLSTISVTADPGQPVVLTFTPENYDAAQTVSVAPVLDSQTEGVEQARIQFQLSGDSGYTGGYIPPVDVTIDDTCETVIVGDFDGNCIVNLVDFSTLASAWLACTMPFEPGCLDLQ